MSETKENNNEVPLESKETQVSTKVEEISDLNAISLCDNTNKIERVRTENGDSNDSDKSQILIIKTRKRKYKRSYSTKRKRRRTVKIIIDETDDDSEDERNHKTLTQYANDHHLEVKNISNAAKPKNASSISEFGGNCYKPKDKRCSKEKGSLRPIFIDGSNVAYAHGKNKFFSVKGLQICINYFKKRGHEVKAFVPNFRLRKKQCSDPRWLQRLERQNLVVITPTLTIQNERRIPYDDWYIVQSAAIEDGIIVSRDNFQDIIETNPALRHVVEERRLVPTFVNDTLIFPVDPLGNRQNNLEEFLRY